MEKNIFLEAEDEETLEQVIRYNIGKAYQIRKELSQLENLEVLENNLEKTELEEDEILEAELEETEEYQYYYLNIIEELKKTLTKEEKAELIKENLPSKNNKNYFNITSRIKLELLKEIQELESLKQEETDEDFIEEINMEKDSIHETIQMIQESGLIQPEEITSQNEKQKNKLIFLKTNTGSIYAENDLYGNDEYFESFKELLLSIENGTFKNVKRFVSVNNALKGVSEVKAFKTRVIFDRLAKDKYIIIDIFVKKVDNDNGYRNMLANRIEYYRNNKDWIIALLDNEEYLAENEMIRDNIMNGLEEKNLVKTLKKRG